MKKLNNLTKRVTAALGAAVLTLGLVVSNNVISANVARAAQTVNAEISYTAQYDGSFQGIGINTEVSSDTAENMGYADSVAIESGVSFLDVWVKIHQDMYPEFNASNKDSYFEIADSSYGVTITNAFAKGGSACSYYKNGAMSYGLSDTVQNGDAVDVFYYQDTTGYSDSYTFFKDVTTDEGYVSGKLVRYELDETWTPVETPVAGVDMGWIDVDSLDLQNANPYGMSSLKTKDDGSFAIEIPNSSNSYMLTVYDGNVNSTPLVRTLYNGVHSAANVDTKPLSIQEKQVIYEATGKYLADNNKNISYGDNKEGYLLGLGRANYPVDSSLYSGYYDSVKKYLADNNGRFDSVTECAKVVAALNAIGYDPTNIDGIDITKQLDDVNDVSGVYANAYALIALDTKNYSSSARESYLNNLLSAQLDSGAWGWNGTSPDTDTTGMVLAALAPYYNNRADVTAAVNNALNYLSDVQMSDGTFTSGLNENSNTTAMVVLGLSELGINADSDDRFVKNGVSAVDALCAFYVDGGGFGWTDNYDVNDLASYQSYYALVSYFRHINGMNRLFDMTLEKNADTDNADTENAETKKVPAVPKTGDKLFSI